MQTFLPLPDLQASVKCLDWRRLGNQRVEAFGIVKTLRNGGRWSIHPAVRMWKGFESALLHYMDLCIEEWINRGYKNNMKRATILEFDLPPWFGLEEFHASHRSNLLRKYPEWYCQFGWTEPDNLKYHWPVRS